MKIFERVKAAINKMSEKINSRIKWTYLNIDKERA